MEYTNLVTVVNRIISIKSMFCLQISLLNSHVSTLAKMLLQSFLQKCFSLLYHAKIKILNFVFFYKPLCENLFDFKVKTTMSQNSLSIWHWKKPNSKWVSTHPVHVNIWILAYRSIRLVRLWRSAAWNRVRFSGFIWASTHNNILSILLSYTGWVREIESNLIDKVVFHKNQEFRRLDQTDLEQKKSNLHFKPQCGEKDKSRDLIVDRVKGKVKREKTPLLVLFKHSFWTGCEERSCTRPMFCRWALSAILVRQSVQPQNE